MARRRRKRPLWAVVLLIAIGAAVSYYQRRADRAPETSSGDAVVVTNEAAPERRQRQRPPESGAAGAPAARENAALGMPTAAATLPDDFLVERPQYTLSYNRGRGLANWVAWHLEAGDIGSAERSQFAPDPALPSGWYRVVPNDYRNSGYDRGHLCPSADRSTSPADNAPTFFMTNIIPQAPDNNQGPWADFENFCRDLARSGHELYIVAGGGGPFTALANGRVAVPATTWKAVLVLPRGEDDLSRVGATTRVIALMMPNGQGIRGRDWQEFVTSVDAIERSTGYDLYALLPDAVETLIEARVER